MADLIQPPAVEHRHRLERQLLQLAPFKRFSTIQRLGQDRSGHASVEHVRHQLYVGRDTATGADALIKVTTKPGLVYEQNLTNEFATLSTFEVATALADLHRIPVFHVDLNP